MPNVVLLNLKKPSTRGVYRNLWVVGEGDIVVSPLPVEEAFLEYMLDTLGISLTEVTLVTRDEKLDDARLVRADIVAELRHLMADRSDWHLMPCIHTEGVAELARLLDMEIDVGLQFAAQRGPELLNRKSNFRRLAVGAELPIAEGAVVTDTAELAIAIERHLPLTGTAIVKRDNDMGGRGNVTLTTGTPRPFPGTRETRRVDTNLPALAEGLWRDLTDEENQVLVVESYYEAAQCFYFEYEIDASGRPQLADSGSFRRRPSSDAEATGLVWVGLELPAELPPFVEAQAATLALRIIESAASSGYRGFINVDAILTTDGQIIFNEINARWGGGLTLHHVARRALGAGYAANHVLAGARDVPPLPFAEALVLLKDHDLLFTRQTGEGVVILGYDTELQRTMECVVIGRGRRRARELEAQLRTVTEDPLAGDSRYEVLSATTTGRG